jgi:hypothetical protein
VNDISNTYGASHSDTIELPDSGKKGTGKLIRQKTNNISFS